eukprot:scaffold8047_cov417-Prasinococcus_capsulatus_cf.AAC.6
MFRAQAKKALALYKTRVLDSLTEERKRCCDFSRSAFAAATIALIAEKNKIKLESSQLKLAAAASDDDFRNICNDIQTLLPHLRTKRFEQGRKRQREQDNSDSEQESSQSLGVEIDERLVADGVAAQSRRVVAKREKDQWKDRVIEQVRKENEQHRVAPPKQLKQSKLSFKPVPKSSQDNSSKGNPTV